MRPDENLGLDRRLEQLGAWSGIAWVVICGGGFGATGLLPVWAASTKPAALAAHLSDIKYQILIGMAVVLFGGVTFLMTWSLTMGYQIKKYANPSPLVFYVIVFVGLIGAIDGMIEGVIASAMAFRVDTLPPDTTQLIFDLIWFLFLIPWAPFMLCQLLAGFAILSEQNTGVMFPRWLAYVSFWAGALEVFCTSSVFYYHGPFSYNGLVTFWVPGASYFIWVLVFAFVQVRGWKNVKDGVPTSADVEPNVAPAVGPRVGRTDADRVRVEASVGI